MYLSPAVLLLTVVVSATAASVDQTESFMCNAICNALGLKTPACLDACYAMDENIEIPVTLTQDTFCTNYCKELGASGQKTACDNIEDELIEALIEAGKRRRRRMCRE